MPKNTIHRGFTLIELLVVVAIISLLTSVVLASLAEARNKANLAAIETNSKAIQNEAEIYYTKNNKYIASEVTQTDTGCSQTFFETPVTNNALAENTSLSKSTSEEVGVACEVSPSDYAFAFNVANLNRGFTTYCISNTGNKLYQTKTVSEAIIDSACSANESDEGYEGYLYYASLDDDLYPGGDFGYCPGADRFVQHCPPDLYYYHDVRACVYEVP
jgi:prepilin-type N-terminal cleavage/methylation domain-containing protein